ncbi:MAG: serine/threonine-protein kinase [Polyangiales bacterium]
MEEEARTLDALVGSTLDEKYPLEAFVARGGFGAVYRSRHPALGCPVAIKVLTASAFVEDRAPAHFVEAFEREARIVAALDHPAIVRVLDVGAAPFGDVRSPYIVLEWIEGETLEQRLRGRDAGRRSPREAFELLRPVFDAIASAHEVGVVHRDLKPSNIMVSSPRRGASTTRVLDFGVAKTLDPEEGAPDWTDHTSDAFSSFSLSHAAPEQIGRLRSGPWTDVHALALLLVEVLVGERAYRGATTIELFASIQRGAPPDARGLLGRRGAVGARARPRALARARRSLRRRVGASSQPRRRPRRCAAGLGGARASRARDARGRGRLRSVPRAARARSAAVGLAAASTVLLLVGAAARTGSARPAPTPVRAPGGGRRARVTRGSDSVLDDRDADATRAPRAGEPRRLRPPR